MGRFETNTLVEALAAAASEPLHFQKEKADRMYSPNANSVSVQHQRDNVFIGCHNCH